jgi:hypothetical protein
MRKKLFMVMLVPGLLAIFNSGCKPGRMDFPADLSFTLALKTPGNPSESYQLYPEHYAGAYRLKAEGNLPVIITAEIDSEDDSSYQLLVRIEALADIGVNLRGILSMAETSYEDAYFYLPGFWYRKNLRSPDNTPSARVSAGWMVREDRLSVPLAAVYDTRTGTGATVCRSDKIEKDVLMPYEKGEIILHGQTDMGSVGFGMSGDRSHLTFGFPFSEEPYTYIRKLTLAPPVMAFQQFAADDIREFNWEVRKTKADSYSAFMEDTWNYAYDKFKPENIESFRTDEEIKSILTEYFRQSYTDDYEMKGFSGVHLHIDKCEKRGIIETGFVGRVLLNAYNALEFGYENADEELLEMAHNIYASYESNGFTENGFIREVVDFREKLETDVYSIRRQSEGLYAFLQFLELEAEQNRQHPELEMRVRNLLDKVVSLQDGNAFPRKFSDEMEVLDDAGGSTSTAVIPLLMGWKYFDDETYLEAARSAGEYLEDEIISKGDYFSSTLDANCEDKEASLYTACAMYYLGLTSESEQMSRYYYDLAEEASYFALSWYYLWDVPFAPGQMLGDLGFKTRGWGNVSVENNHVDVYIFDFADVIRHLSVINGNSRLAEMAELIKSSMREQLLPVEGRLCGIAKVGYYPEVVQHTNWDYGQFGKGYYNDLFAPGWTVASLWELLSEDRLNNYFTGSGDE